MYYFIYKIYQHYGTEHDLKRGCRKDIKILVSASDVPKPQ
jgi:hypothetical protein